MPCHFSLSRSKSDSADRFATDGYSLYRKPRSVSLKQTRSETSLFFSKGSCLFYYYGPKCSPNCMLALSINSISFVASCIDYAAEKVIVTRIVLVFERFWNYSMLRFKLDKFTKEIRPNIFSGPYTRLFIFQRIRWMLVDWTVYEYWKSWKKLRGQYWYIMDTFDLHS